jgi:hypothetical protein
MRTLWLLIALLVGLAIVLVWRAAPASEGEAAAGNSPLRTTRDGAPASTPTSAASPARPSAGGAVGTAAQTQPPEATVATQSPQPSKTPLAPLAGGLTLGLDKQVKGATVRPGRLVEKDGAILADGKYTIKGSGTAESPYEISWELLMSAADTFIPRLGEKQIPQRIAMLDGAHVRISGYIAFPLIVTEASECLVMLNQWDGCCIGVPPSPYDAIEVKLSAPADNSRRHVVRVGTLQGVFRIDPYVVEKWLVGLYLMESATLDTEL